MIKQFFFAFSIALILVACEQPETGPAGGSRAPEPSEQAHGKDGAVTTPSVNDSIQSSDQPTLNLKVTEQMMNQVLEENQNMDLPENADAPSLNLEKKKSESRVNVKGEVYFDETQQDYMNAVEGGKIDVELRFQE